MPEESTSKLFLDSSNEDAEEVFLFMHGKSRVSRSVRAKWLFDHMGQKITIDEIADRKEGDISVVGAIPKYDNNGVEEYRVSKNTTLTYLSESYQLVFVMDLSPSTFSADEYGDVCYVRILKIVETCVSNVVKKISLPNGKKLFRPQIYVTFCAFSPFLCFTDDSILLQGIHITEENIGIVLCNLRHKFDKYINNLCTYFQPFIRDWAAKRRKFRSFAKDIESALYASDSFRFQLSDTQCPGFMQPDWSLIGMLRMGLLGIQLLRPDSGQSNLILVTDGCCAIPDGSALSQVISQLRSYTTTCSFIQSDSSIRGAALGHVSFPELFKFIATATFGRFMYASELTNIGDIFFNFYHRAFLTWNFKMAFPVVEEPQMPAFLRTNTGTFRKHQYTHKYKISINKLLYVRLHEGYTIKDVNQFVRDGKDMIKISLTLLWKPNISIEYVIVAPWHKSLHKVSKISVEFYIENFISNNVYAMAANDGEESLEETVEGMAQVDNLLVQMNMFSLYPSYYKIPRDLAKKIPFFEIRAGKIYVSNAFDKSKYKDFAQFWLPICVINEMTWRKWLHIHTLRIVLKEDEPVPNKIFTISESVSDFSQIQCREAGLQVLELFNRRSTFVLLKDQCFVNILFTREQSTPQYFYLTKIKFDSPCMIIKITFVGGMSSSKRLQVISQLREELDSLNIIRANTVFVQPSDRIPGVSVSSRRRKNVPAAERRIQECVVKSVRAIDRPLERVLVRYSRVPQDLSNIVRLEDTQNEAEIREMITHNAIAKYLSCRRTVWEIKSIFPRLRVHNATMEFILQLIVKRRLKQDFRIAYGSNGIVNMVRQVEAENNKGQSQIEQCVIFGPVLTDTDLPPPVGLYDSGLEYPGYMDALRKENSRMRPKSWPRIATEVWLEPQDFLEHSEDDHHPYDHDLEQNRQSSRNQLLKEDDTIIRSIFTFDQLMSAAESGIYAEEANVLNKVASVMARENLSGAIYSYKDVFDPKAIMDNADCREFMLLPGLGYSETEDSVRVDARLENLLKYVQAELMKFSDCCVDALDDAFLWDIVETCENHFGISRFFAPEDWSFGEEKDDAYLKRRQMGARSLIQTRDQRDLLRNAVSDGSSAASTCSDLSYSTTKNATSGGPNSPSDFVEDEEDNLRGMSRPYDVSPLSRSITFACDNDPYSVAEQAAVAALNNLDVNMQMRANSVPNVASDSEDNVLIEETAEELNLEVLTEHTSISSFVTKDLSDEIDQVIALTSSYVYGGIAKPSSSNSSTTSENGEGNDSRREEKKKSESDLKSGITKKFSGDRSRNASGIGEKKLSREEGFLNDSFRAERKQSYQQTDIHTKNEEREEAIKRFPPIPLGGFGVYARRLGPHRMVLFFVPKNAKTVRLLMPHCGNSFPVFAYFVDKLRMAQRLVEKGCDSHAEDPTSRGIRTIVEDFTQKARISTLAFLNQQLHDRLVSQCIQSSIDEELPPLDEFYLRALDSQLRAELEPPKFQLGNFDLRHYVEKVFEEYMFTKAFIAATFSSIGQSVHVPQSVLKEATEYRCEHARVELGSIHSIMKNSCFHLKLYEELPNKLTNTTCHLDPLEVNPLPNPKTIRRINARPFFRLFNGCLSNFNDFSECFDRLLQAHNFKPVPGLPDYYFFWPYRKAVLRFANVDDVSTQFAEVFCAVGDDQVTYDINTKIVDENRQRSESGSRILAEARNATQLSPADMWPLFIQFSVAVIGPDGKMETAPLSTIPNCLKQLAETCSIRPLQLETEGLTGQSIRIAIDLYILTWPLPKQSPFRLIDPHLVYSRYQETQMQLTALHRHPTKRQEWLLKMAKTGSSSSSDDENEVDLWTTKENQSDDVSSSSENSQLFSQPECDDEDELFSDSFSSEIRREEHTIHTHNFLNQLPKVEYYAVKQLQISIQRMLTAEQLFEWARKCEGESAPQPTLRLLSTICQFVSHVVPPDSTAEKIMTNECPEAVYNTFKRSIIFTGDHNEGVRLLCDRLTQLGIGYVHLRRFNPQNDVIDDTALYDDEEKHLEAFINTYNFNNKSKNSTLFYACFVDNMNDLGEFYTDQILQGDRALDAYKEPPPTPFPVLIQHQVSANKKSENASKPRQSRRARASSWSPTLSRRKAVQSVDVSSSEFDSSSGEEAIDVVEPLKDSPNDRLSSSSDPTSHSTNREHRRSRLKRQVSRHYFFSGDSLHNSGFCSDGEVTVVSDQLRKRQSLSSNSRDKTPEPIVGSEGTVIAAEQVWGGENAPKSPTKCASDEDEDYQIETRNGFPLDWLVSSEIYKENENPYHQKLEPFMHDFWLVFNVEHSKFSSQENPLVTVYFVRRFHSPHTQLIRKAVKALDEQIHIVNQQLLLNRMLSSEECDQLLIDSPETVDDLHHLPHRSVAFYVMTTSGKMISKNVPCADETERQKREISAFDNDDASTSDSTLLHQARARYSPGHFACEAVWYHWFRIHPRLQPVSRSLRGSEDLGFHTIQMGLERFSVKNRPNLYVFQENFTGNIVYIRLFSNDAAGMEKLKESPYKNHPEPPDSLPFSCVLLVVHGVEKPSTDVSESLISMLEKKLNSKTQTEIQDILFKNSQVRLESEDACFIQPDSNSPTNVFYFSLPSFVNQFLQPFVYYFEQQTLLFCSTPHFREQSGAASNNSGSSTPRGQTNRSSNPIKQQSSSNSCHRHGFQSYEAPGTKPNSKEYKPMFFLLNRPPSQGRRDIGLACIETKIVDTNLIAVSRTTPVAKSRDFMKSIRQFQNCIMASKLDRENRLELFSSLMKVRRIKSPYSNTTENAFLQLAIWQNGQIDIEELSKRFRICIQQALSDLYIEFGLLSMRIFDATKPNERCPTSPNPSLSAQTSTDLTWSRSEPINLDEVFMKEIYSSGLTNEPSDKSSSEIDLYAANVCHAFHEDFLPTSKQSVRTISGGTALRSATSDKNLDTAASSVDELIPSSSMRPTRISSVGTQVPTSIYSAAHSALAKRNAMALAGRNNSEQFASIPPNDQFTIDSPPPLLLETGEYLRDEFALSAANWMDFVSLNIISPLNNPNSYFPTSQDGLKRFTFALECDRTMRKVMQVVYDRLCLGLLGERCVCLCRSSTGYRRLQLLWNAASLSENAEKDYGRVLTVPFDNDFNNPNAPELDIDIALLAYNEQEYNDSLRYVQSQGQIKMPETLIHLCNSASRGDQLQLFLPNRDPFIPRKRLLYVVARNETLTLFLYNYSSEISKMACEIVERTVLWHNTRSRLLCDIGLHKMGITHLSSLDIDLDSDVANNYSYLRWMDPETLIYNDYPPPCKKPDFKPLPRKYAQLLFKLYRFAEPAFVAKNFALDPFDDQTQQMLTLREDVKGKLNDHHFFGKIHQRFLKNETHISEDKLNRIISRSHHAHYVQSPLLLFTSWRYRIAAVRNNIGNLEESVVTGQVFDSGIRSTQMSGDARIQLSPVPAERKKRIASQQSQPLLSPVKSDQVSVKLLPAKVRSKTAQNTQPTLKQYMKRPTGMVKEPSPAVHEVQKVNAALNFRVLEQELCLLKVQYMLVEDYLDYLQTIGLTLLDIKTRDNSDAYNLQYSPECSSSPNAWLYLARPGGIIFANVTFVEPYFSVRFLFWNSSQLTDHIYANSKIPDEELAQMREIELLKNELIQKSHVHSFSYDFHLRMVSKYLCGGKGEVLFNPGYNTNAFLIDFVKYYGCRPPYARNCIYEEHAVFQPLRVKEATIWDYFLSNDQQFGWNVVRIKTLNNREDSEDEFMLIAKEQREFSGTQPYQLICIVVKCPMMGRQNENQIELKLYVLMVSEENRHPLPDINGSGINNTSRARLESGEFAKKTTTDVLALSAPSPLSIKKSPDSSPSNTVGGEFTRIEQQPVSIVTKEEDIQCSSGHVSRIQSYEGTMNEKMLDDLIAMSKHEIMNDLGLQPCVSKRDATHQQKCPSEVTFSQTEDESVEFRRRATSTGSASILKKLKNVEQKEKISENKEIPSTAIRSSSSDVRLRMNDAKRRNSDFPLKVIGGSLTRLDYHAELDDVWKNSARGADFQPGRSNDIAIDKFPQRRHRENFVDFIQKLNTDIILPNEQVAYVHYLSNQQRRLQHLLEESARIKKSELEAFVFETERICYINELWKSLLSSKSSLFRPRQTTLFSSSTSKHDSGGDNTSTKIPHMEMDPHGFNQLIQMICIEPLAEEEPRLKEALKNVNFGALACFLVQQYEKDKMYRYFEQLSQKYLIILNPSCLDSAMLLRDSPDKGTELFISFKNTDIEKRNRQNLALNAIHDQFEKLMNYISTYLWMTVVQEAPTLK